MICTRCDGMGFLNIEQLPDWLIQHYTATGDHLAVTNWIESEANHDVCVCDCCGDGERWHGYPGLHGPGEPCDCA
jgi:hypothetical protein